jgi:hypothetical protein
MESIHLCSGCNSLFNDVDFELTCPEIRRCPICETAVGLTAAQ